MASRRGHGEGSIYQRKSDNLWVGTVDLGWVDGKRKRKVVYGATRARKRVPVAGPSDRQNVRAVGSCSVMTLTCENGDGPAGLSNDDGLVSVSVSRCRNH